MIERKIIIGLIVSTEFIQQLRPVLDARLMESPLAQKLARWCLEYFDKYNKAPGRDIEGIYFQKLRDGLPEIIAEQIEQDILPSLNEEYKSSKFNLQYLLDLTKPYLKEKRINKHIKELEGLIEEGNLTEAENLILDYKPGGEAEGNDFDLSDEETSKKKISKGIN